MLYWEKRAVSSRARPKLGQLRLLVGTSPRDPNVALISIGEKGCASAG